MRKRVAAVIIKNNKILLMRRVKNGREYFVFPGGRARIKESFESAVKRVIKSEFNLDIIIETFLFRIENKNETEFYFLVKDFEGSPRMNSEERQIINDHNQYYLEWKNLSTLVKMSNLLPKKAKNKVEALAVEHDSRVKIS